jgi:hypothetical protein
MLMYSMLGNPHLGQVPSILSTMSRETSIHPKKVYRIEKGLKTMSHTK